MGIDPNNHKPHQSFSRPHASSAEGASTSESMNKGHNKVPIFKSPLAATHHRISFTEQESAIISSPSLNLDLTIALPSSLIGALEEDTPVQNSESTNTQIDLNC